MNNATNAEPFVPQEIAYRKLTLRGPAGWKRKICKTEASFDRFIERLSAGDHDIEVRDCERGRA